MCLVSYFNSTRRGGTLRISAAVSFWASHCCACRDVSRELLSNIGACQCRYRKHCACRKCWRSHFRPGASCRPSLCIPMDRRRVSCRYLADGGLPSWRSHSTRPTDAAQTYRNNAPFPNSPIPRKTTAKTLYAGVNENDPLGGCDSCDTFRSALHRNGDL